MDQTETSTACDRIEAALWRIDAALARAQGQSQPQVDTDLLRRHELLREAAASALLAIDAMIADGDEPAA